MVDVKVKTSATINGQLVEGEMIIQIDPANSASYPISVDYTSAQDGGPVMRPGSPRGGKS